MPLVAVYDAYEEYLCLTICDLLRDNGIAAMIQKEEIGGYNLNLISAGGIWGKVLIEEENANKAIELIGAFQGTLGELSEAEPDPEVADL